MKTWVQIEEEVEVNVSIAEVMSTITGLSEADQAPMAFECINSAYCAIKNLPDSVLEKMTDEQRSTVAEALRVQAARFAT